MSLFVEWGPQKVSANERRHGVLFDEVATAVSDPFLVTIPESAHSAGEDRFMPMKSIYRRRIT